MKGQNNYTLREIKAMVSSTANITLPTAKALRESGDLLASCKIEASQISIYKNGFALYETDVGVTVFRTEDCGDYIYHSAENKENQYIPEEVFSNEDWTVRFILEGEDRLWHNQQALHNDKHGTKLSMNECHNEMDENPIQPTNDFIEEIIRRDECKSLLSVLTEKQRCIVESYYLKAFTQQEIADQLNISQPHVVRTLRSAIKKIRKIFKNRL